MSGAKIKNFIILVFLLTIGFLLILVIPQQLELRSQTEDTGQLLAELCAQAGISLDPEILPEDQTLYELELSASSTAEMSIATLLLEESVTVSQDASLARSVYTASAGSCSFSGSDGGFSAELTTPRQTDGSLLEAAQKLLSSLGYDPVNLILTENDDGTAVVTATQQYQGVPVFSANLTLTYVDGALKSMDGVFHTSDGQPIRLSDTACITCADAIVAFLGARDTLGWVGAEITDVTQGYIRSGVAVNLTPVWRITTDTGTIEVNGITRAVSLVT